MEDYIQKLRHIKRHGGGHAIKKILVIVVIVAVAGIITLVVLAVMAATWLFNKGNDIQQTGENLTKQAQSLGASLKLDSYISGNQVNTEQLQKTFNGLPSQLQGIWLNQLKAEIDKLRAQAGVSDEMVASLTATYEALKQSQNK